ncbi:nucleoporin Nup35 [Anopheles stephensi]|uniref:Nucleoporin NUP35 n=1 Tax=Anopheles stephensi TaxID=30069 RepID=A0A182YN50_ANOST|nr:nucleoporin Nup35 [Anopheles stephensi]
MEPMTLGSPSGSSLSGVTGTTGTGYLPSFLMGDPPTTPRPTTLSPTRGRSSLAYPHGLMGSPSDGLRSPTMLHQQQPHPHQQQQLSSSFMHPHTPQGHSVPHSQRYLHNPPQSVTASLTNHFRNESFEANSSITGPPTQGLFDSWRKEKQLLQTPIRTQAGNGADQSTAAGPNQPFNESFQNQSGFNLSRVMSPIPIATDYNRNTSISPHATSPIGGQQQTQVQQAAKSANWITVFGFPANAASKILSHFIGIGTIVDKQAPSPQNGNWVHLRYSSRLECDRALNYNGRIISQGLMIGVQYCNDPAILGKENDGAENDTGALPSSPQDKPLWRVRSLMNMSYTAMQDPQAVISAPPVQKRGTGIVNKAMDLFFGW